MSRIAIIGAGAGGLAAAYDLVQAGNAVTIYEADHQVGGLAGGFKQPHWDWSVEKYYHHWFASDRHMLELIRELGWTKEVFFPWPATVVYHQDRFYPLDAPFSQSISGPQWLDKVPGAGTISRAIWALRFPGLSWRDKLRYGLTALYLLLAPSWRPLETATAHDWLNRWVGESCYSAFWEPLLISKFGSHYRDVNMAWLWARVKARTPRLGTFEGGFQRFMDRLADRVQSEGAQLCRSTAVQRIAPGENGALHISTTEGEEEYDQCLATVSPRLLARLAPSLPQSYLEKLLSLKSMGAVVLVLSLKRRLSEGGFYWHNLPKSAGFPFLSLVEHTNFISPDRFAGEHIVYCGDYLDPDHEYFSLTQAELLDRFLPALPRFNPEFSPNWVNESWLYRTPYAQPVPPLNHSRAIPDIKTPMPGLWFASMSQVYPWDRGTNFAVEIARKAAKAMLAAPSS